MFHDIYLKITEKQTSKHIALAQSIIHLIRSKHLVNMLNEFGHSINCTAIKNIQKEVTTAIVYEDIDRKLIIAKNIV